MPTAPCIAGYPFHSTGLCLGTISPEMLLGNQANRWNQIAAVAALSAGVLFNNRANRWNQEIIMMRLKIF